MLSKVLFVYCNFFFFLYLPVPKEWNESEKENQKSMDQVEIVLNQTERASIQSISLIFVELLLIYCVFHFFRNRFLIKSSPLPELQVGFEQVNKSNEPDYKIKVREHR